MRSLKPLHHMCEIISADLISGQHYRYKYTVKPVAFTNLNIEGDVSNSTEEYFGPEIAYNLAEFSNTVTTVNGYQVSNIPSGFDVKPVSGLVLCQASNALVGSEGTMEGIWIFDRTLIIDGTCS